MKRLQSITGHLVVLFVLLATLSVAQQKSAGQSTGKQQAAEASKPLVNLAALLGKPLADWEKALGKPVSKFEDKENEPGVQWITYKVAGLVDPQLRVDKSSKVLSFSAEISKTSVKRWEEALGLFGFDSKGLKAKLEQELVISEAGPEAATSLLDSRTQRSIVSLLRRLGSFT